MGPRELFHFFAAAHFWFGCYYDWFYVIIPSINGMANPAVFSGKLKFLTYWNALLQSVFFTVCLINDLIGTNEPHPKVTPLIRRIKDTLLTSLVFPISMFVASTFWALYLIDRELILPKAMDPYFPGWLNHIMHTNIALSILLELFTTFRRYPNRKQGFGVLSVVMLGYLVWLHIIHHHTGTWVYPILTVLNFYQRLVFFASMLVFQVLLYLLGEKLNSIVWKKELKYVKLKA